MAKSKRTDHTSYSRAADHPGIQAELVNATDRAAAIVAAALLDVQLERLLRAFLIDDAAEVRSLISGDDPGAPLGGFSAKIRACYALGLISMDTFHDLKVVRDIRNAFAHHVLDCTFSQPVIAQNCAKFRTIEKMTAAGKTDPTWPARVQFTVTVYSLESTLVWATANVSRRQPAPEIQFAPAKGV